MIFPACMGLALQETGPTMGVGGWTFMGLAWAFVLLLVVFCFTKVIWGDKSS